VLGAIAEGCTGVQRFAKHLQIPAGAAGTHAQWTAAFNKGRVSRETWVAWALQKQPGPGKHPDAWNIAAFLCE